MRKLVFTIIFLIAVGFIGTVVLSSKPSVLFYSKDHAAVDPGDELFVVFNPTRDREPEKMADRFLDILKNGDCEKLIQTNTAVEKVRPNCEREQNHRLIRWELVNREENGSEIKLQYRAYRKNYPENVYGNVWITVQKQTDKWDVINYEAWY